MRYLIAASLAIMATFTGCATRVFTNDGNFVQNDLLNKRKPEKVSMEFKYPNGVTAKYTSVSMGSDQTGVANMAIGAWGMVKTAAEATAQVVSNNGLKAAQAKEATAQVGLLSAPTKYLPAEGEAISRAGGAVVIP